jgi:hypothetical protein
MGIYPIKMNRPLYRHIESQSDKSKKNKGDMLCLNHNLIFMKQKTVNLSRFYESATTRKADGVILSAALWRAKVKSSSVISMSNLHPNAKRPVCLARIEHL